METLFDPVWFTRKRGFFEGLSSISAALFGDFDDGLDSSFVSRVSGSVEELVFVEPEFSTAWSSCAATTP